MNEATNTTIGLLNEHLSIMSANEEGAGLHPAAGIFLNVIAGEINAEKESLKQDVERLQPLLDHIQKVEVMGTVDDGPIESNDVNRNGTVFREVSRDYRIISTVKLSQGTIVEDANDFHVGERLVIPIESTHDLLLKNLGMFGGIGAFMADQSLGQFPDMLSNWAENTDVTVDEDDRAYLTIFVSDYVSISGELSGLSNEDIIKFKGEGAQGYLTNFINMGFLEGMFQAIPTTSSNPIFKPSSIAMDLNHNIRETLNMIERATKFNLDEMSPSDELRHLTVEALGDDEDKTSLDENRRLKLQRDALFDIREKVMRVDISHSNGKVSVSLRDGKVMQIPVNAEGDEEPMWVIQLYEKENSIMTVNSIKDSLFSMFGIHFNTSTLLTNLRQGNGIVFPSRDIPFAGILIPYAPGVEVVGLLNWYHVSDDDVTLEKEFKPP